MSSLLDLETVCEGFSIPDHVRSFEHAPGTRVCFGPGVLDDIGKEAALLGKRAMIVTDPGLVDAGYVGRAVKSLAAAGLEVTIFASVQENPSTADVRRAVEAAEDGDIDLFIGLGGGSSMDCAKGCNFILTNGGEMKDYWGKEKATKPMLPLIAVPTTAGTGSECQSFALIADEHSHAKMACGDKKAAAKVALLDPELTLSQPSKVTALTAIDALSHAIESYVCRTSNEISRAYALAGFHLMRDAIGRISSDPKDLLGRSRMQVGAAMAGTAIENSMLGASHSMANPLTAHFGVLHGQAIGVTLPAVIRRNAADASVAESYRELHPLGPLDEWVTDQVRHHGLATRLQEIDGVDQEQFDLLGKEAASQWTAQFNPVELQAAEFTELYRQCW